MKRNAAFKKKSKNQLDAIEPLIGRTVALEGTVKTAEVGGCCVSKVRLRATLMLYAFLWEQRLRWSET